VHTEATVCATWPVPHELPRRRNTAATAKAKPKAKAKAKAKAAARPTATAGGREACRYIGNGKTIRESCCEIGFWQHTRKSKGDCSRQ